MECCRAALDSLLALRLSNKKDDGMQNLVGEIKFQYTIWIQSFVVKIKFVYKCWIQHFVREKNLIANISKKNSIKNDYKR